MLRSDRARILPALLWTRGIGEACSWYQKACRMSGRDRGILDLGHMLSSGEASPLHHGQYNRLRCCPSRQRPAALAL
jgi:hypothetical protein